MLIVYNVSKKGKRGVYRRAVGVATVPLAFWFALRFTSSFFALIRCLRHATRFVLFIPDFLSFSYKFSRRGTLFFAFHTAFKLDLGQFFGFIATVKVFIFIGDVFIVVAIIAQHAVLRVSADGIATALRWEADLAKHVGMLIIFANHQAYLPVLHRQDSCGVAVATLHEVYQ